MELILQVISGNIVTIGIIMVLGVTVYAVFRLWQRRKSRHTARTAPPTPHGPDSKVARISLCAADNIKWPHPQQIQELSKSLQKLGFRHLGDFSIPQMPDMYLRGLGQPGKKLAATIYDHPLMAPLFEVAVFYQDDTSLTVSSNALAALQDAPPPHPVITQSGLKPKQTLELITQYDTGQVRKVIDRNCFIEEISRVYARRMDWKIKQGHLSEEFVQLTARAISEHDFSEDEMEAARLDGEAEMAMLIEDACLDNFFRQSRLDANDWDNLRTTLFVIHERMDRGEIVETLAEWLDGDQELYLLDLSESLYDVSGIELFRQINQTLPEKQRMIEMGRVEEPLNACIYMAPG
jgi:hypothetical protein